MPEPSSGGTARFVRENPWAWIVAVGALGLGGGGAGATFLGMPTGALREIKDTQGEIKRTQLQVLNGLQNLDRRMEKLEDSQQDAWQRQQMEVWGLRLQRDNPTLVVPEVQ